MNDTMVNAMLLLSGIGMMLVAVMAVYYWRRKTRTQFKFFLYGGIVWLIAVAAKLVMDLTVSMPIQYSLMEYPIMIVLTLVGLYVGLRTGFFESGFTYLFVKKKIRGIDYKKGVAFGIGFGSAEAFLIGLGSFLGILIFVLFPESLEMLSPIQKEVLLETLNMDSLVVFAPIIERISVLFIHVFSTLLVFFSIKSRNLFYLFISIAFKTLTDGMIPWLINTFGTSTVTGIYLMEIPIVVLGMVSFLGIRWMHAKFTGKSHSRLKKRRKK